MEEEGKCSLPKLRVLTTAAVRFLKEVVNVTQLPSLQMALEKKKKASLTPKPRQKKKTRDLLAQGSSSAGLQN